MQDFSVASLEPRGFWAGQRETLGFCGAVGSLAVSMVGIGVVALPHAFALCGYVGCPVALGFICVLAFLGYAALVRATTILRCASYTEMVQNSPCGVVWQHYTRWALVWLLIMATTAYVIIAADMVRSAAGSSAEGQVLLSDAALFAAIIALIFPICLTKSLQGLSVITMYCSLALFVVVAVIIGECTSITLRPADVSRAPLQAGTGALGVLRALPILGGSMFGHMNIGQVYAELLPEVKPRWPSVVGAAMGAVVLLYFCIGCFGYLAFGRDASPDVVVQLAEHTAGSVAVVICQALLGSFIVLKTPFLLFPLRGVALAAMGGSRGLQELSPRENMSLTGGLLLCVYIVGLALPQLDLLLQVLGGTCALPLCYIVPARLSWVVEKQQRQTGVCIFLGVAGLLISVLSLVATFMHLLDD